MTTLTKPVHRLTRGSYSVLYAAPRAIVISLKLGDVIEFREKGRKQVFTLPIDTAFRIAVRNYANQQAALKKAKKKGLK